MGEPLAMFSLSFFASHKCDHAEHADKPHARKSLWFDVIGLLVGLFGALPVCAERLSVRYPLEAERETYPIKVLTLALKKSGVEYTMAAFPAEMAQSRALMQLAQGHDITITWTMTSKEREQGLLPIRIPIDKGLLGWRLFLINKKDQAEFAKVKSLTDLKLHTAGQGHDWPDTAILQSSGLSVQVAPKYDNLFRMLQVRRFDYFPRSVMEIWDEQKRFAQNGVVVEETLLVQYPAPYYFFVNKNDKALASAIENGLNIAIKDGSFDVLFNQAFGDAILRAHLNTRTRLQLNNPLLPAETPLSRKELWMY